MLVKIKSSEEKTTGGILLPTSAQSKPQNGVVVEIGEGKTIGKNKVDISIQVNHNVSLLTLHNRSPMFYLKKFYF